MRSESLCATLVLVLTLSAFAQTKDSCTTLRDVKVPGVEITKAAHVEAGSTEPIPWNQNRSAALPAYCRIEGVLSRHTGVGGEGCAYIQNRRKLLILSKLAERVGFEPRLSNKISNLGGANGTPNL